jgi:hypothetical protein
VLSVYSTLLVFVSVLCSLHPTLIQVQSCI